MHEVMKDHGANIEVVNYAVPGATTTDWTKDPDRALKVIDENPGTEYIWLSIGSFFLLYFTDEPHAICLNRRR